MRLRAALIWDGSPRLFEAPFFPPPCKAAPTTARHQQTQSRLHSRNTFPPGYANFLLLPVLALDTSTLSLNHLRFFIFIFLFLFNLVVAPSLPTCSKPFDSPGNHCGLLFDFGSFDSHSRFPITIVPFVNHCKLGPAFLHFNYLL
jgi:hypothetical protein